MKLKSLLLLIFITITMYGSIGLAQSPLTNMELNRAPLRYFSGVELTELAAQDAVKSNQIKYYFTESFEVTRINCDECRVDFEVFYNREVFNIVDFEEMRQADIEVTFTYKEKYEIKLRSGNTVMNELGGISPEDVLKIKLDRAFPQWTASDITEAEYQLYKSKVMTWAVDFPSKYRELTSNSNFLKIPFSDFSELIESRREELLTRPGGYLIID